MKIRQVDHRQPQDFQAFGQEASKQPQLEWEKWIDLFEDALMAKNKVSITELTKTTGTKDKSLMGDPDGIPPAKKAISILYLALVSTARNCRQLQTSSKHQHCRN